MQLAGLPLLGWLAAAAPPHTSFYVAPSGDDGNAGTVAAPFASLRRAQLAVRQLKVRGGAEVVLRGGVYSATGGAVPLELTAEDSGSASAGPVVWRAYEGEEVTISGGVEIPPSAFSPRPGHPGQQQANLTAIGLVELGEVGGRTWPANATRAELFFDHQPMHLVRPRPLHDCSHSLPSR